MVACLRSDPGSLAKGTNRTALVTDSLRYTIPDSLAEIKVGVTYHNTSSDTVFIDPGSLVSLFARDSSGWRHVLSYPRIGPHIYAPGLPGPKLTIPGVVIVVLPSERIQRTLTLSWVIEVPFRKRPVSGEYRLQWEIYRDWQMESRMLPLAETGFRNLLPLEARVSNVFRIDS